MTAAIELVGISRRYGDLVAVDDVNLHVEPGEFVTLLGASGCGKTTLLRITAGLDTATAGSVTIDGKDPASARRAKRIGWVPQSPALLPWLGSRANVELLRKVNRASSSRHPDTNALSDIDDLLTRVGLEGFEDALPHELSGGMQQRVALVRAFALDADVLLMDEPFAALDEITRADMRHLLLELWERSRTTVLFVTHSVAEAAYLSDRVAVMSDRPGTITSIHDVSLPRPRHPDLEHDPSFFTVTTTLGNQLQAARR